MTGKNLQDRHNPQALIAKAEGLFSTCNFEHALKLFTRYLKDYKLLIFLLFEMCPEYRIPYFSIKSNWSEKKWSSKIFSRALRVSPGRKGLEDDIFKCEKVTRQSKQCGFSIYIFDNSKSKSMVRLVRSEKMALSGLVFARKIARMILIQNI